MELKYLAAIIGVLASVAMVLDARPGLLQYDTEAQQYLDDMLHNLGTHEKRRFKRNDVYVVHPSFCVQDSDGNCCRDKGTCCKEILVNDVLQERCPSGTQCIEAYNFSSGSVYGYRCVGAETCGTTPGKKSGINCDIPAEEACNTAPVQCGTNCKPVKWTLHGYWCLVVNGYNNVTYYGF